MILRYGIDISDISKVYLAGGFGYHIDLDKAIKTGLLDEALRDRIIAVGNSSRSQELFWHCQMKMRKNSLKKYVIYHKR